MHFTEMSPMFLDVLIRAYHTPRRVEALLLIHPGHKLECAPPASKNIMGKACQL